MSLPKLNGKTIIILLLLLAIVLLASAIFIRDGNKGNLGQISISGGVVPHHLTAKEIIQDFFEYISLESKIELETVILLSPDHFNSGNLTEERSFITLKPGTKEFNNLKVDNILLDNLTNKIGFNHNNSFIVFDHGITALLPYIKKYFPETKILPILIPFDINKEQTKYLAEIINSYASSQAIVIASVDFSHYLSKRAAEFHDVKSINTLVNFREDDFENLEVDCWQCLYGTRLFAKLRSKESPKIIAHKNSSDFLKLNNLEETTSYFSVVFEEDKMGAQETFGGETILFVGDIMLDRWVEDFIIKNSVLYPFQKIEQFLRGVDLVFGNLEGPIVNDPQEFSRESLKFAFSHEVTKGLSFGNFDLFSLANNHTLNMGKDGLEETREILNKENFKFVGDPIECTKDFIFQEGNIIFLAFNKTYPFNCSDEEIAKTIEQVKSSNPQAFLIVSIHWGEEYQLKNSISQQRLAHKMIDAGADLIIGHHPHVVQNIEIYSPRSPRFGEAGGEAGKERLIFYSLGNFIFDQYFSKQTQQGLAVGLEIYPSGQVFRLFPIQSQLSQPFLMEQAKAEKLLEELALRSSPQLFDEIKNGIIKI